MHMPQTPEALLRRLRKTRDLAMILQMFILKWKSRTCERQESLQRYCAFKFQH